MASYIGLSFAIGLLIYMIYCNCRVARRLGYDGLSGLLLVVPLVNIVVWSAWAFNESPNERSARLLRGQVTRTVNPASADALNRMMGDPTEGG